MLKELTEKIRKAIPRLMELEDGCMVKYSGEIFTVGEDCNTLNSDTSLHLYELNIDIIEEEYQIIGKEPMLNDVLEWLDIILVDKDIHCEIKKKYIIIYPTYNDMMYCKKIGKWDLSKPYLKDQSKELIEKLNNL